MFSWKGIKRYVRVKQITEDELGLMEKTLQDEVCNLNAETKKRLVQLLVCSTLRSDLYDMDGRERVLRKGAALTAEAMADVPFSVLVRSRVETDDLGFED